MINVRLNAVWVLEVYRLDGEWDARIPEALELFAHKPSKVIVYQVMGRLDPKITANRFGDMVDPYEYLITNKKSNFGAYEVELYLKEVRP